MSPDEMRLFADLSRNLGELSGTLQGAKEALQANAQETKENTKALQEGKQTFAEIKGELSHIKKTAPCLNGLPLPPNCARRRRKTWSCPLRRRNSALRQPPRMSLPRGRAG
jgi:hypothetical protein